MPKRATIGPRYAVPSYTVKVRGEHGCAVVSNPYTAAAQVACYLSSRPGGVVDVTYSEHCAHCRGSGRVPGKRRMSWQPCKRCKGEPDLFQHRELPMTMRLTTETDILAMAADMARRGETPGDIADAIAAHTGLLRSFVVDLLRRKQSLWLAA